jgi:hypothetical protein
VAAVSGTFPIAAASCFARIGTTETGQRVEGRSALD